MEKDLESVPTASDVPSCIEACAEWSDSELKDAPAHAADWSPRTIGLTDDQMRSAAMLFGVIILFFAGIGVALTEFMSAERQVALMDCVQIVGDTERLACYDKAATQSSAPFKGGSPFPTYSRPDVDGG